MEWFIYGALAYVAGIGTGLLIVAERAFRQDLRWQSRRDVP